MSYEPPGTGGRNYGWSLREGLIANPAVPSTRPVAFLPLTDPLFDYPRSIGTTVTGGYVYRGAALGASYFGRYFVADYGSGRVWSVGWQPTAGGAVATDVIEHTSEFNGLGAISSFAVDLSGELYMLVYTFDGSGRVLQIVPGAGAPGDLTAQVSGRDVTLNWTGSAGPSQYRVDVGSLPGATDLLQHHTGSTATSLSVSNIPEGTYYVRIRALDAAGASPPSNEIVVQVGCRVPAAPTNIRYTIIGRFVTVSWDASGVLTNILLEIGHLPSSSSIATLVLPPSARSIRGAVDGGSYYVRLRGVNACGVSGPSAEIHVTVE